jgi:hypothetical protein
MKNNEKKHKKILTSEWYIIKIRCKWRTYKWKMSSHRMTVISKTNKIGKCTVLLSNLLFSIKFEYWHSFLSDPIHLWNWQNWEPSFDLISFAIAVVGTLTYISSPYSSNTPIKIVISRVSAVRQLIMSIFFYSSFPSLIFQLINFQCFWNFSYISYFY